MTNIPSSLTADAQSSKGNLYLRDRMRQTNAGLTSTDFLYDPVHNAGQAGQHCPLVVVGAVSGFVHKVGKHHTSLQNVLALPPCSPVAPVTKSSSLMLGLTQ